MVTTSDLTWPLVTTRLSIRPATPLDVKATWEHRRLPEVSRWISWEATSFEEYAEGFLHPERLASTLVVEHEGAVIGDLMLRVEDAWAQAEVREQAKAVQAELGWCLHPSVQGRGLATEAVATLMELCFERLRLRRVVANCFADNDGSWRLMERLGMRREVHTIRESLHRSGEWLDGFGYALLAEEWQALREPGAKT